MNDPNRNDDEALSALLDDALPPDEADRLRARLAHDPGLMDRFEAMQNADMRVRTAYGGIADEPLPQSVLELLEPEKAAAADADAVVPFPARFRPAWLSLPVAIAAAAAFSVGALSMLLWSQRPPAVETGIMLAGPVEPGTALHNALQTGISGTAIDVGAGAIVTPRLTFRDTAGDYCRQIDIASRTGTDYALVCRRAEQWRVELVAGTSPGAADGVFTPAAGDVPEAIQTAIAESIADSPLGRSEEARLIAEGWMP